jgi:hypothetical protein
MQTDGPLQNDGSVQNDVVTTEGEGDNEEAQVRTCTRYE